ncbi:MAG: RdgB/HAM1 family non-canonical purine NTP pyrophosphatase [Thermomicrobiales bacterium]
MIESRSRNRLLVATSNPGKLAEFRLLLPASIEIVPLDATSVTMPEETGRSFAEIADLKAIEASRQSRLPALADDSGLEVDALGGDPGILSARYAGEPADSERNIDLLLTELATFSGDLRAARFRCAVSFAEGGVVVARAEGSCEGHVADERRGAGGFGYDAVFVFPDGRHMAESTTAEKNLISHRALAYRSLLPHIVRFFDGRTSRIE